MNAVVALTGVLATLLASAAPALAHHSFAAEYDATKAVRVCGVVTKVEWTNPHARFYVKAQDSTGRNVIWNFELGPPGQLSRLGWSRHSLSVGTQVTVNGYRARDGSSLANATTLTLADGRKVSAGSSAALNAIAKHDVPTTFGSIDRRLHQ